MLDSKTLKSLKCKINIKFFGLFFHDQLGDAREQNAILNLVDPELQKGDNHGQDTGFYLQYQL